MKIIGSIDGRHIENRHNALLTEYSKNLPEITRLITKHLITPQDEFVMKEGYKNFQLVRRGEILGYDKKGPVKACKSGMILMPLYQKLGDEGFFLVEDISNK
jgi:succinylglutamate desuccinylase